jgi:amino acid adenylation domain-containing protein
MEAEESFSGLVKRVREVALGAYAHQDVPFEKLVEAVQTERSLSHDALFQVMFQFINIQTLTEEEACDDTEEETCEPDEIEVERGTAKFDLGLDMWESGGRLIAGVEYREDLFDDATIARMLKHFEILLESAVANPDRRISELALLTESERDQLLKGWNSTKCTFPADKSVHQLFEAQVERTPDAVAVVSENEQLSYRELNARANKLARYLQRLGVGPEVLVGICVKRSVEMMVGLLGILKAGGAYVPLDPAYPKQRLKFMLDDAQAPVLLTQQLLLEALPEHKGKVICLDRDWESVARESDANVDSRVQPENLAYVIYTSGSTGKPKGVTIQHKSLVNWTTRAAIEYGLKPDDRVLQFSSISFDTAAEEIYPCLTLGGTLVLRSDSMSYSIPAFLQKCREFQISVLDLPTAYWHELTWELSLRGMELPASVRLVIVGGERALPERLSMWHQNVRESVRLMQGYGPTEATVVATIADLSKPVEPEDELREVSIGRPIGNAEIYILDEHLQPVPVGVSGELYIGGEGLARGYLHRPELTAEKFIPHPFSRQPGARLYRTGDVARYRLDGEIEFLGRRDEQVKMRGYRIELGEIEAVLREHPSVREAVVLVREDVPDDKRLVAYLVADDTGALSVSDLRSALSEHLPGYMIPSAFMLLDALPLTPNGKVNREALPEPMSLHDEVEMDYVAPRNEIERVIAGVWQEIFGMERLSVNSNFFDLGGHSLTLVRVHSKLRERLGKEISLIDMFKYPTISALANYFSQEQLSRELEELALHQRVFDRAEKQKEALNRRKQTMRQRVMTNG